jgi:hypothetical protein
MEYEEAMFFNDANHLSGKNSIRNDTEGQWHKVSPKRRNKKASPSPSRNSSPQRTTRTNFHQNIVTATRPNTMEELDEVLPPTVLYEEANRHEL